MEITGFICWVDVYKRQTVFGCFRGEISAETYKVIHPSRLISGGSLWNPVSYTHLDVYKRQVQQVGSQGAGGSLAMRTCHAQAFTAAGDDAQFLGALMYVEAVFTEIGQFCMPLRHGGGIDHERACLDVYKRQETR